MSWSSRRRFSYASITTVALLFAVGIPMYFIYHKPPSCFDGKQNKDETGIDCGGGCSQVCSQEVAPLVVRWSRAFKVTPGNYNAVAYVENPNISAGVKSISYRFDLFDAKKDLIISRTGKTFISPGAISPVFESAIMVGDRIPVQTFFEITKDPLWFRTDKSYESLSVKNRILSRVDTKPRIDATIVNTSPVKEFHKVETIAVVFGTDGNAIAASRTILPLLSVRESKSIVFTWPYPFSKRVEKCVAPSDIVLLVDTSGSMNDDGGNPPQPISDAKTAATSFVNRLSSDDRVGVVSFATQPELLSTLSPKFNIVTQDISNLSILPKEESGNTNIGEAISIASKELSSFVRDKGDERVRKVIVLLTDGRANLPKVPGGEEFAQEKAAEAKENGVIFYTIGLGDKINSKFLSTVASLPDNYFQALESEDLDSIYRSVSESICERGPSVIDIIPRSLDIFN